MAHQQTDTAIFTKQSGRIRLACLICDREDFDGVDVSTNTEIFFLPKIVLDNGIQIGANIQLEGETSGDQIDESYVQIKGSFGEVNIGSENSAGSRFAAPMPIWISVPADISIPPISTARVALRLPN